MIPRLCGSRESSTTTACRSGSGAIVGGIEYRAVNSETRRLGDGFGILEIIASRFNFCIDALEEGGDIVGR